MHSHASDFLCKEQHAGPWLIACSGGSDSVFLVLMLMVLFPEKKKDCVIVHYNHKMRGKASDEDVEYVEQLAEGLGVRLQLGSSNLKSDASHYCSEEVLREARMRFLKEALRQHQSTVLILGHQMNDVLETMLMRLSRGSGLAGLIAPRPVHYHPWGVLVRPLLALKRENIQSILREQNVQWREDASNQEGRYYRNRLRGEVIPRWLEALVDKQSERDLWVAVADTRDLLEDDENALQYAASQLWPMVYNPLINSQLNAVPLRGVPRALVRRVLHRWLNQQNIEGLSVSSMPFEKLVESCALGVPVKLTIASNSWLELNSEGLLQRLASEMQVQWTSRFELSLHQASVVRLPGGMEVKAEIVKSNNTLIDSILGKLIDNSIEVYLSADGLNKDLDKLIIRSWAPGDRYQPLGAPGTRKLQDLFIDRKIVGCKRHELPIVLLNDAGTVIWVPNLPPAESFRIFPTTKYLLKLTYQAAS
jgi:tRNA(Ile)-lysidine synthase